MVPGLSQASKTLGKDLLFGPAREAYFLEARSEEVSRTIQAFCLISHPGKSLNLMAASLLTVSFSGPIPGTQCVSLLVKMLLSCRT
jgi:hypothetical protein